MSEIDRSQRSWWWRIRNPQPATYDDGTEVPWYVILPMAIVMGTGLVFARDPAHFIKVVSDNLF